MKHTSTFVIIFRQTPFVYTHFDITYYSRCSYIFSPAANLKLRLA
jgi:hypothetical protein